MKIPSKTDYRRYFIKHGDYFSSLIFTRALVRMHTQSHSDTIKEQVLCR